MCTLHGMKDDKKARAIALLGTGLSDREIARRVEASNGAVSNWRRAAGIAAAPRKGKTTPAAVPPPRRRAEPSPADAVETPAPGAPTGGPSFAEEVRAVRAVLGGDDPPEWLDEDTFLRLARTLSSAENQHRMSKVREAGVGLSWEAALDCIRYIVLAAGDVFATEASESNRQKMHQLGNLVRAKVREHNERLAREV